MSASRDNSSDQVPRKTVVAGQIEYDTEVPPPNVLDDDIESIFRPKMVERTPLNETPFEKKKSPTQQGAQWDATK